MSSENTRALPRRAMLAVSGTAALAAAAACSPGTTATGTSAATPAASSRATPSDRTSVRSPSSAATSASTVAPPTVDPTTPAAPPSEAAPTGTPVASVADVQAAGTIVVGENENAYLLTAVGDTVVAHTAVCTHQRCTVGVSGLCPCHQSRFDVATGAVINGPALRPLAERGVTISGGQVYLD